MPSSPAGTATEEWLDVLIGQTVDGGLPDLALPAAEEVRRRMRLLAIPAEDRGPVLASLPDPVRTPRLWQALRSCHGALFAADEPAPQWPAAPAGLGAAGRYFYVHLYLLALPHALERQYRLGVPSDVVAATFADVGAKLASYRRGHRTGGFDRQAWVTRHFRGTLHRLGRLQFERTRLDAAAAGGAAAPGGPADGEPVLGVHVPGDGPMRPADCADSLRSAREFAARYLPGQRYRYATCSSWLLDDQLVEYLRPEANILHFQRRFTRFGSRPVGDDDVLEFVFGAPPGTADLDRLPQDTTLQRALVRHLRTGRHWHVAHGWTTLDA